MVRTALALLTSAVLQLGVVQQPVDTSGRWLMDEKRSGSPTHEAFVGPVEWVIQQSAEHVSLERRRGGEVISFTYLWAAARNEKARADVVAPTPDGPGNRAYWDDERLVLETMHNIQGKTVTTKEVLSVTGGGRELMVERVIEVEHGYTLKGARNASAVKDIFVKSVK